MIEKNFKFSGEEGFHARPVSEFVDVAKRFESKVEIEFEQEVYEGKSPLSIMCGCIEDGCVFTLRIEGSDEKEAYEAIYRKMALSSPPYFLEDCDKERNGRPLQEPEVSTVSSVGIIPLSGGIAIGKTWVYRRQEAEYEQKAEDTRAEGEKLFAAIDSLKTKLEKMEWQVSDQNAAGILKAHQEILSDQSFVETIQQKIFQEGFSAVYSIRLAQEEIKTKFEALKSERMRERAADIKDISSQLIDEIMGTSAKLQIEEAGTIIVAEELLPSDTIHMDPSKVVGFITEKGGKNSHSAIVARSLGIPAISNVEQAVSRIPNAAPVILDGDTGCYFLFPDEETTKKYDEKTERIRKMQEQDNLYRNQSSCTTDGCRLELSANIFGEAELENAIRLGAEGVGLFRTEFLYMNRPEPPSLEEQFTCYKNLLEQAGELPVTIRTLDAGGDKPTPCLHMPKEENPFLGVRAIRFCLRNKEIFCTQLKALLMASAYGNLRIMFPMISMVEELQEALKLLNEEKEKLTQEGIKIGSYQVGVMIETPSAAVMSGELAKFVDFFSIGSNDLNQYVMAADRGAEVLSEFHSPYHPAVLRLIYHTVRSAEKSGIWVGVCGESGGDPLLIPLYVGMGIRELSMSASKIASARRITNNLCFSEIQELTDRVLSASTEQEMRKNLLDLYKV